MRTIKYIASSTLVIISLAFILLSCDDLLDENPTVDLSDAALWTKASDFAYGTNKFYEYLPKVMHSFSVTSMLI